MEVATPIRRIDELLERFAKRDKIALARLITLVENRAPEAGAVMERIYASCGTAQLIGITGPPGAGKSTLINRLVAHYRAAGRTVAVLAIDPSSPFSGGAVLGDRVRMGDHYRDPGVFIRSLSSRGSHGGLSRAAREVARLVDAFGYAVIMIETVGVGQTELAVMDLVHTTVVVTVPEGGDGIQMMKAGLNEIADIFVVNKADRDGADRVKAELELSVHLRPAGGWRPPVLLTQAAQDKGVDRLVEELSRHFEYLREHQDPEAITKRLLHEFQEVLGWELEDRAMRNLSAGACASITAQVGTGALNPYSAARRLLSEPGRIVDLLKDHER